VSRPRKGAKIPGVRARRSLQLTQARIPPLLVVLSEPWNYLDDRGATNFFGTESSATCKGGCASCLKATTS